MVPQLNEKINVILARLLNHMNWNIDQPQNPLHAWGTISQTSGFS